MNHVCIISQVPHFINASEKTPSSKVQQPNFADFSHFKEEVNIKAHSLIFMYLWVLKMFKGANNLHLKGKKI